MDQVKMRKLGKRALKTWERNDAIRKAAMALARRRKWPSPPVISDKTGISASVIERETELLLDARREWEKITGQKHPQWRDPKVDADAPLAPKAQPTESDGSASKMAEMTKRHRNTIRDQRQTIAAQKEKIAELEEQVRLRLVQIRPPELGLILEAGTPKRRKGKSKKRVAVGA